MKKLLWIFLISCGALGQTFTPNLSLQLPPRGAVNWDSVINHNFSTLDATIGRLQNPFMGIWSSTVVYFKAQQVTSGGLLYVSLTDFNLANTPASSPTLWANIAITGVPTPHAFLSATHTDTVAASPVRGDGIFAIGATPTWQRVAHPSVTNGHFKWNGTDIVASLRAAAGDGACTNQFVSAVNGDALPTCNTVTPAFAAGNTSGSGNFALTNAPTFTGITGTDSITMTSASTLSASNIKQASSIVSFAISDNLGVSHFFISGTSPYTNTFVNGNGGGVVFLGSAAKTSVADTTGNIVTAGTMSLQTTSQTLPATVANDTAGGINFTSNGGKTWTIGNTGNLTGPPGNALVLQGGTSGFVALNPPATAGSSQLTLPAATDTLIARATTDTVTNKRLVPRIVTLGSSTTFTPDGDNSDQTIMNMTGVAGTLTIAAPTGTPTDGQKLILRIKSTNAQTYSFNATYAFSTTTVAPTTVSAGKTDYIGVMWDATNTKWDVVAVDQGH